MVYRAEGNSMTVHASRIRSKRHHRPNGLAVATVGARNIDLGKHDAPESRAEYGRIIAEWLSTGRRLAAGADEPAGADSTVNERLVAYLCRSERYDLENGKPTSEPGNIRALLELYGLTLARDFRPVPLKAIRRARIDSDFRRNENLVPTTPR